MKNLSQPARWRPVPISLRRRKSLSETTPTSTPASSITGRPLMCIRSMIFAAPSSGVCGVTATTSFVMTWCARMITLAAAGLDRLSQGRDRRPRSSGRLSSRLDADRLGRLLRVFGLRQGDLEHAVLERRLDLVGVDAVRQGEIPLEAAIAAL